MMESIPTVIAAIVAAVTTIVGAVGGVVGTYLTLKHKQKIESDKQQIEVETSVVAHYGKLIEDIGAELKLHRANAQNSLTLLRTIEADHSKCRVSLATIYRYLCEQHAHSARMIVHLRRLDPSNDIDPGPSLPKDPLEDYEDKTAFAAKTLAQTAENLKKIHEDSSILTAPTVPLPRKTPSDGIKK